MGLVVDRGPSRDQSQDPNQDHDRVVAGLDRTREKAILARDQRAAQKVDKRKRPPVAPLSG